LTVSMLGAVARWEKIESSRQKRKENASRSDVLAGVEFGVGGEGRAFLNSWGIKKLHVTHLHTDRPERLKEVRHSVHEVGSLRSRERKGASTPLAFRRPARKAKKGEGRLYELREKKTSPEGHERGRSTVEGGWGQ